MAKAEEENLRDLRDSELVRRCRQGRTEAFDVLVHRHQEKIFNAVLRFCGNWEHACDITQRAFINAFRKIRDFKGDAAFSTWMYRIAFNQSISFRREQGRQRAMSLFSRDDEMVVEPAVEEKPEDSLETDDDRRLVHQALQTLDEEDRRIIILKDLEDCSYTEIASILAVPKGTVRSRLHRARQALKEKLKTFMGTRPGGKASK